MRFEKKLFLFWIGFASFALGVLRADADDEKLKFFETRIRPVLVQHCFPCHSQQASTLQGSLWVDSLEGLLTGGDSGSALDLKNSSESILLSALRHQDFKMPPKGKLSDSIIRDFEIWLESGAFSPDSFKTASGPQPREIDWDSAWSHWAFKPLDDRPLPVVKNKSWIINPIDRYVLHGIESQQLSIPEPADRATIIRRVFFDLTGLPPTPAEQTKYYRVLNDPQGFGNLVNDLLASPQYGERWGRHWLDVARYSDSNGADENKPYPLAWRYRNYVIEQFNRNLPYDQFIHQQIAGDLLEHDGVDQFNDHINATTFLALGVKIDAEQDLEKKRSDIIDEQIDTIGRAFLGLTIGCARCHDHKFDPFTSEDYYALAGVLGSTELQDRSLKSAQTPILEAQLDQLTAEQIELRKSAGLRMGEEAIEQALQYLAEVPEVIGWQKAELGAQVRLLLSESANQPLLPVGGMVNSNGLPDVLKIQAEEFSRGNFGVVNDGYGAGIGIISDRSGSGLATFEHDLEINEAGVYQLDIRYAALDARPGQLFLNGELVNSSAVGATTGGWNPEDQRWHVAGRFQFIQGKNVLRFEVQNVMSHIDQIAVSKVIEDSFWEVEAEDFTEGDFERLDAGYGAGVGIAATSRQGGPSFVEYLLDSPAPLPGRYLLQLRYAANEQRPMVLKLDEAILNNEACSELTGGWMPEHQKWFTQASVNLTGNRHRVRLEINNVSVHLDKLRLVRVEEEGKFRSPEKIASERELNPVVLRRWAKLIRRRKLTDAAVVGSLSDQALTSKKLLDFAGKEDFKRLSEPAAAEELHGQLAERDGFFTERMLQIRQELMKLKKSVAMAVADGPVGDTHVFIRGNHLQKGALVNRRAPRIVAPKLEDFGAGTVSGRLQLARAITDSEVPLAARVMVNRVWRWHFGKAIVESTENFGSSGAQPTHPGLLDYLSRYFVQNDWNIKKLHRHIMESSTYRMGFRFDQDSSSRDRENRWYWRSAPRRLEAEAIRDSLLMMSGELDLEIERGVLEGITTLSPSPEALKRNREIYEASTRRSVYLPIVRTNVYQMFSLFDFPNPAFPTGNRNATTVPTQSLLMMNHEWVAEIARKMAARLFEQSSDDCDRVKYAYRLAFARKATAQEVDSALDFISEFCQSEEASLEDAWIAFCHLVLLSNEMINVN
jgi:hypothetical protein